MLIKVISGGQTGADEAGLYVAKNFGIRTGGFAPKYYKTKDGPNLLLKTKYGLFESEGGYKTRTWQNVSNSDGTIRLAMSFNTPGEVCTLNAITSYKKPHFNVDLRSPPRPIQCCEWLIMNDIEVINIAGNSETGNRKIFLLVSDYLTDVFRILASQNLLHRIGD